MSVTETLGALGSWDLQLADETPDYVVNQLGFFGHIAVIDGTVDDVTARGDALLTGARYVGVLRAKDKDTGRTLSGSGMVFWLGDEDGKGDILETEISLTAASLSTAVTAIVGPSDAVTVGTIHTTAGTYTGKHQFQTRREALSIICDAFNVEFRVNGDGTVDVGTAAQLYNTEAPDTIVVRKGAGTDMDLVALGGDYTVDESVYDYSTRVVLLGQTIGMGDTPDEVFATGSANAPSVPYLDLYGNPVKIVRPISESGTTSGSVAARAQLQLNRFNRVARSLKVTAEEYETEGNFVVGDNVYVYDPDTGIVNAANQVDFRGEVLHPDIVRASGITWPVVQGMTVAFRTQAGVWLDLTPFVTWETGGNELTVGDLPKSLTKPGDNAVQVRLDAVRADASIPNAPTSLTLTTSSTLNAQGVTGAVIHASWTAPSLNTDGSVITDLSHYVVEYRWTARAPLWQQANATDLTEVDLIVVPGLPYEVRVTAVDLAGNSSAPSATGSITSAADAIAPNAPADPVVTSYLGQLRIEYAGTDSTGNPMASDTNRIDVHVGTTVGFTASTATRVSSITPFAKGIAYATAPYGSTRYVRLIAVDHSGNSSASSAVISGATTQVADGDVASLSVGKLTAGTMSADVVTAGRFTTALTGARREMNAVGFQAFDASNTLTVSIDGVNNLLTGILQTALTGRRITVGASGGIGTINFIAPDGTTSLIRGFTSGLGGVEAVQMCLPISGAASSWNGIIADSGQTVFTVSKAIYMIFGGATSGADRIFSVDYAPSKADPGPRVSRLYITPTSAQMFVPDNGDFFVTERTTSDGTLTARMYFGGSGLTGLYRVAHQPLVLGDVDYGTDSYAERFRIDDFEFHFKFFGPTQGRISITPYVTMATGFSPDFTMLQSANYGARIRYVDNGAGSSHSLHIRDAGDTTHIPITASAFTVSSSEETKTSIGPWTGSATEKIRALELAGFRRKGARTEDGEEVAVDGEREIGVIAEAVAVVVPELAVTDADGVVVGVDLGQTLWMVLGMAKEIDARLKLVEERTAA